MERDLAGRQIVDTRFDPDVAGVHGIANNGRGRAQQIGLNPGVA
jgi:hypothetical protein